MYELIKVLATIELFAGENMRQTHFFNKYRPLFYFADAKTRISGSIDLIERDSFSPGMSGVVEITFIKGMIDNEYFSKGVPFTFSEGGKFELGKGCILEVVPNK